MLNFFKEQIYKMCGIFEVAKKTQQRVTWRITITMKVDGKCGKCKAQIKQWQFWDTNKEQQHTFVHRYYPLPRGSTWDLLPTTDNKSSFPLGWLHKHESSVANPKSPFVTVARAKAAKMGVAPQHCKKVDTSVGQKTGLANIITNSGDFVLWWWGTIRFKW